MGMLTWSPVALPVGAAQSDVTGRDSLLLGPERELGWGGLLPDLAGPPRRDADPEVFPAGQPDVHGRVGDLGASTRTGETPFDPEIAGGDRVQRP